MPEHYFYIASDGTSYRLTTVSDKRSVLNMEGSGLPPIDYITERGPYQHGETVRDYFLRPRIEQYAIRQNFCSRQEAIDGGNALLDAIRPNRTGGPQGVIRRILPNGSKRDLTVAPIEGPRFQPSRDSWDKWSIQEILRFQAFDPVYFDPDSESVVFGPCGGAGFPYTFPFPFDVPCELQFPITFPITFEGFDFTDILTNEGTWESFPIITILGPAQTIQIDNLTTDQTLRLYSYRLESGRSIIIDLSDGVKTVELDDGTNLIDQLWEDSDLSTWSLVPGENEVQVTIGSHGAAATVTVEWNDRFIGIGN